MDGLTPRGASGVDTSMAGSPPDSPLEEGDTADRQKEVPPGLPASPSTCGLWSRTRPPRIPGWRWEDMLSAKQQWMLGMVPLAERDPENARDLRDLVDDKLSSHGRTVRLTDDPAPRVGSGSAGLHCWVCLEDEAAGDLVHGGCACRGTAGFGHVGCVAKAAEADESVWLSCPTCKQIWTGALFVKLARHRYTSSSQLPEDDPDRLAAGVTYVHALLKSAQIAECIRVAEATLLILRRSQGHMSKSTVELMGNLASAYVKNGDFDKGGPLLRQIMDLEEEIGEDHPIVLHAKGEWASMAHKFGDLDIAEEVGLEVLSGYERLDGPKSYGALVARSNLGFVLKDAGDYPQAEKHLTEAIAGFHTLLGEFHEQTVCTTNTLAHLYGDQNKFAQAIVYYEKVLASPVWPPGLDRAVAESNLQKCRQPESPMGTLCGLTGAHEPLNESIVVIQGEHSPTGCYAVAMPGPPNKPRWAFVGAAEIVLHPGTPVVVRGVVASPELNGQRGTIHGWDVVKSRYTVRVEGRESLVALTPAKCRAPVRDTPDGERDPLHTIVLAGLIFTFALCCRDALDIPRSGLPDGLCPERVAAILRCCASCRRPRRPQVQAPLTPRRYHSAARAGARARAVVRPRSAGSFPGAQGVSTVERMERLVIFLASIPHGPVAPLLLARDDGHVRTAGPHLRALLAVPCGETPCVRTKRQERWKTQRAEGRWLRTAPAEDVVAGRQVLGDLDAVEDLTARPVAAAVPLHVHRGLERWLSVPALVPGARRVELAAGRAGGLALDHGAAGVVRLLAGGVRVEVDARDLRPLRRGVSCRAGQGARARAR